MLKTNANLGAMKPQGAPIVRQRTADLDSPRLAEQTWFATGLFTCTPSRGVTGLSCDAAQCDDIIPPPPRNAVLPYPKDRRDPERRKSLPLALAACASSVERHYRGETTEEAMREGVRAFARDMHAIEVPPERAIAQLKETILRVPSVAVRPAMERGELLRVLVQDAIAAYYTAPVGALRQ